MRIMEGNSFTHWVDILVEVNISMTWNWYAGILPRNFYWGTDPQKEGGDVKQILSLFSVFANARDDAIHQHNYTVPNR